MFPEFAQIYDAFAQMSRLAAMGFSYGVIGAGVVIGFVFVVAMAAAGAFAVKDLLVRIARLLVDAAILIADGFRAFRVWARTPVDRGQASSVPGDVRRRRAADGDPAVPRVRALGNGRSAPPSGVRARGQE